MTLAISDIQFEYKRGIRVLDVAQLTIARGETVALVGRNGSGKSTLLHCLAGLLEANSGQRKCTINSKEIALVFQTPCLDKKLTVVENLRLFGKVWGLKTKTISQRISLLAPLLQLNELLDSEVQTLSGGQQRRADLARALLSEPKLLFLDEPTVGLDLIAQREFWSVLAAARKSQPHLTLVCASHHAAELNLFDRLIFLEKGKIHLDILQNKVVEKLPAEALEITTATPHDLLIYLEEKFSLQGVALAHNKIIVHTNDSTHSLSQIKTDSHANSHIESTLVRRTQLADAVWQQLVRMQDSGDKISQPSQQLSEVNS
ncbi:ABC transporter ATP-binding protein [bacterium]|nr:ABC transporter ATP-binding protein [bacterium]